MLKDLLKIEKYYNYEVRAAKSTLKTEVDNSYLNWIWWILDPLFTMAIYYLIFGVIFGAAEQHLQHFCLLDRLYGDSLIRMSAERKAD